MIDYVGAVRELPSELLSSSACGRKACSLDFSLVELRFIHE